MAHRFDPKQIHKLDNPERRKLLPPEEIIAYLQIQQGDIIADIGCGPGYFSIPLAKKTKGTVFAVDVEPLMFDYLKEKADQAGVDNISYVHSHAESLALPDAKVDKVFCAFILHEIGDLSKGLLEIKRILHPNGKILILEWEKKKTESGPPVEERIAVEDLREKVEGAGFHGEIIRPNPNHYMILAKPKQGMDI